MREALAALDQPRTGVPRRRRDRRALRGRPRARRPGPRRRAAAAAAARRPRCFVGRGRYRLGLVRSVTPQPGRRPGSRPGCSSTLTNDGPDADRAAAARGAGPLRPGHPAPLRGRPDGPALEADGRATPSAPTSAGKFAVGPDDGAASPTRSGWSSSTGPSAPRALVVTPRVVPLPAIPLAGAWTGAGDNRPRAFAERQRRGRHGAGVPPRRRPAPGALALQRAGRRADGPSRGAALAVARHAVHRQPAARPPRQRRRLLARARGRRRPPRSPCTSCSAGSGSGWSRPRARSRAARGTSTARRRPRPDRCWSPSRSSADASQPNLDARWLHEAGHAGLLVAVFGAIREPRPAGARPDAALRRAPRSRSPRRGRPGSRGAARRSAPSGRPPGWRRTAGAPSPCGPRDPLAGVWQELGAHRRAGRRVRRQPMATPLEEHGMTLPRTVPPPGCCRLLAAADHLADVLAWAAFAEDAAGFLVPLPRVCLSWPSPALCSAAFGPPGAGRCSCQIVVVALWLNQRCAPAHPSAAGCPPRTRCECCVEAFGGSVDASQAVRRTGAGSVPDFPPLLILGGGAAAVLGRLPRLRASPGAAGWAAAAGASTPRR